MRMSKIALYLSSLFIFLGSVAAPVSSQSGAIEKVRILAPGSTSSVPLFLLADEDPIPGIDLEIEIFTGYPQALALLLRGEADLLFTGTSLGWENYLDGGPLVMINTGSWGISYIIGKDPAIKRFSDLEGKRIAIPFPGSPLDFQTRYILKRVGIDPDRNLSINYSPPSQTMARLIKGQLDAAPLPEPLASYLVSQKGLCRLIDYKEVWAELSDGDPRSPQVSLFTTQSFSRMNREFISRLMSHWGEAVQRVIANPEVMARKFSKILGFAEDVVSEAIRNTLYYLPSPSENMRRVSDYYNRVRDFLPGVRGSLDRDFFFVNEK